jgi:hypothetical protein
MLGLREPSWTGAGEVLNVDQYAAYRGSRHDECAKFTRRDRDPALFGQLTEFLETAVRPRGFAYKDVIQPFVVTEWSGLRQLRVLHVHRDPAEVACAMLRQGWFYPASAGDSKTRNRSSRLVMLEAFVAGLLAAERALAQAPATRIEFDDTISDPRALAAALRELYPDIEQRAVSPLAEAAMKASRSRAEEIRRAPEYVVVRALIARARAAVEQA